MGEYIYQFKGNERPELAWDPEAWTTEDEVIASEHFAYLKKAAEEGVVIMAGRDPSGKGPAIVIFEAEDMEGARKFMENDPFVSSGLFLADLWEFRVPLKG